MCVGVCVTKGWCFGLIWFDYLRDERGWIALVVLSLPKTCSTQECHDCDGVMSAVEQLEPMCVCVPVFVSVPA